MAPVGIRNSVAQGYGKFYLKLGLRPLSRGHGPDELQDRLPRLFVLNVPEQLQQQALVIGRLTVAGRGFRDPFGARREKHGYRHAESICKLFQPLHADIVAALLVLLYLLVRHAYQLRKRRLRKVVRLSQFPYRLTYGISFLHPYNFMKYRPKSPSIRGCIFLDVSNHWLYTYSKTRGRFRPEEDRENEQ